MAPAKKKAAQVRGQQGLGSFFGGSKSPAAGANAAPSDAPSEAPKAQTPAAVAMPKVDLPKVETKAECEPSTALAPKPAEDAKAPASVALGSGGLTEAQKQRIEENKRKALERKEQKRKLESSAAGNGEPGKGVLQESSPKNVGTTSSTTASKLKQVTEDDNVTPLKKPCIEQKGSDISPEKLERRISNTSSEGNEDMFRTFGRVSWMQYNSLYKIRLQKMRESVVAQAQSLWANEVAQSNFLSHVTAGSADSTDDAVAVGILYKDLKSRDNVIEKYQTSQMCGTMPEDFMDRQENLCSDGDVLWLEDHMSRIELELPMEKAVKLSTGFVVAVRGRPTNKGKFLVKDVRFPSSTCVPMSPSASPEEAASGPYVAFLSGLFIGSADEDVPARSRIVEFFTGKSSKEADQRLAKAVQRLIVCGGTFGSPAKLGDVPPGLADADTFFAQISESLPVEVLPGQMDPSNLSLPQMPMHPYFFRSAKKTNNFKSVSNPYQCTMEGLNVLGHSGQPIHNLLRCTSVEKPLEALTTCLDARLLAPTAPDTLGTQPFADVDPFVIDKSPHILFSGGHDQLEFEWRTLSSSDTSGTLCICIPAFKKQPAVVLVNLRDPRDVQVHKLGDESMSAGLCSSS